MAGCIELYLCLTCKVLEAALIDMLIRSSVVGKEDESNQDFRCHNNSADNQVLGNTLIWCLPNLLHSMLIVLNIYASGVQCFCPVWLLHIRTLCSTLEISLTPKLPNFASSCTWG